MWDIFLVLTNIQGLRRASPQTVAKIVHKRLSIAVTQLDGDHVWIKINAATVAPS